MAGITKDEVQEFENSVNEIVEKSKIASEKFKKLNQEQVDKIFTSMYHASLDNYMRLAKLAVDDTGRGVYEDKVSSTRFITEYVYDNLLNTKTAGKLEENEDEGYELIADPIGIIVGITPFTNHVSTIIFKSMLSMKTRNCIIFAFHPSAQESSKAVAEVMRDAAIKAGAPEDCILWIEKPSAFTTSLLMNHKDVDMILSTGGMGMVKATFASGKTSLGIGSGNVPCYIEKTANIENAVTDLVMSKSYDNGMLPSTEESVIVDNSISKKFEDEMKKLGCYFVNDEEKAKLQSVIFDQNNGEKLNVATIGQTPYTIANAAGFSIPESTKVIVVKEDEKINNSPFSKEKLSPVLSYYTANSSKEAVMLTDEIINHSGMGHSAVIHSNNEKVLQEFSNNVNAGRIIINAPSVNNGIGNLFTSYVPSLTLGCGTYSKNQSLESVSSVNLINVKKVTKRKVKLQTFNANTKLVFERGAISYLEKIDNIEKVVIVTDNNINELGYVDKALHYIRKKSKLVNYKMYSEINKYTTWDDLKDEFEEMKRFKPDTIIALGGGSVINSAKLLWHLYEENESTLDANNQEQFEGKAKFIAIPTTSGSGNETTSYIVASEDKKGSHVKYNLSPDLTIIDPELTLTMPKNVVADSGMNLLAYALESYVSLLSSDYSDGLVEKAVELVFNNLENSYNNSEDEVSHEKMHNASAIMGLATNNTYYGLCNTMSRKISKEFNITQGKANAILLPYIIKYNSSTPSKISSFSNSGKYVADLKYATLSSKMGLPSKNVKEGVASLIRAVQELNEKIGEEKSFSDLGIDEREYVERLDDISNQVFIDNASSMNPRLPMVSEIKQVFLDAYYGEKI